MNESIEASEPSMIYASEPAFIGASLVELAQVKPEELQFWICPCCSAIKAVYVQDQAGHVWFGMTLSGHPTDRQVTRIDLVSELDDVTERLPEASRWLLAGCYAAGLKSTLTRLLVS